MQYKNYFVNVTSGSTAVEGISTAFIANSIIPGYSFKVFGDPVVYTIASVPSNTSLVLSTPYQGETLTNVRYVITTDYTPNLGLAEVNPGDQDWPTILTQKTLRKIDTILGNVFSAFNMDISSLLSKGISLQNVTASEVPNGTLFMEGGELKFKTMGGLITTVNTPVDPVIQDAGSRVSNVAGTWTHTFTSDATVTLVYLKGAGGGAGNYSYDSEAGEAGSESTISIGATVKASAQAGGGGGVSDNPGVNGEATNTIGGTNLAGGAANGGVTAIGMSPSYYSFTGGAGGSITGGSFAVTAGSVLTVVLGGGGRDFNGMGTPFTGGAGTVSLSWGV